MNWPSVSAFFEMGGYAFYVWGSFGVVALALASEVALVAQRRRNILHALRRNGSVHNLEEQAA